MKKHNTLTVWEQMRSWLSRNLPSRTVCNNNIQLKKIYPRIPDENGLFLQEKENPSSWG